MKELELNKFELMTKIMNSSMLFKTKVYPLFNVELQNKYIKSQNKTIYSTNKSKIFISLDGIDYDITKEYSVLIINK